MVAETEDSEDESLAIDCPVLVTERLVLRRAARGRHPAARAARRQPPRRRDAGAHAASLWRGRGARLPRHVARSAQRRRRLCADACRHRHLRRLRRPQRRRTAGWSSATGSASPTGSAATPRRRRMRWSTSPSARPAIQVLHVSCRVINPASRRVIHKCGFQYAGQGMLNSIVAGQVPVERYRLDRKTWASLRSWA